MTIQFNNDEYAANFSRQLEEELTALGNDVLDKWLKDVDSDLKKLINDVLDDSLASIAVALAGDGDATFTLPSSRRVTNSINKLIENGIEELFEKRETTVNSRESDRSREAELRFKESTGQQQARAAQEVNRGNRNL